MKGGQKKAPSKWDGAEIQSLAVTYFHMGTPTLSSALNGFTSEFGMGSGGSRSLWPPGKTVGQFASTSANQPKKVTIQKLYNCAV